jgi:hypothetical protein
MTKPQMTQKKERKERQRKAVFLPCFSAFYGIRFYKEYFTVNYVLID